MNNKLIESIGLFAGFLGILAWIPQIIQVWIKKKYEGISVPTLYLISLCVFLWFIYGIFKNAFAIIVCNILVLLCLFIIIIGIYKCKNY
jgi:uncharacterized protein with PQ loop repeat